MREITMLFIVLSAAAMVCVPSLAQMQPGSSGGIIGKTNKSIGGEEVSEPHSAQQKGSRVRAKSQLPSNSGTAAIVGHWQWHVDCGVAGHYSGDMEFTQVSGRRLTGSFISDSGAARPGPFAGVVQGNHASFTRESIGRIWRYGIDLDSSTRIRGTVTEAGWTCSLSASKE
jgi:hypothetical protein